MKKKSQCQKKRKKKPVEAVKPAEPKKPAPAPVVTPPPIVQPKTYPKEKKSKTGLIIAIVAIVVVVVVIVAVLTVLFMGGGIGNGGTGEKAKFYGEWDTSMLLIWTFNSDSTLEMGIPYIEQSYDVGFWALRDGQLHLTITALVPGYEVNVYSGSYDYVFSNNNNNLQLTPDALGIPVLLYK